MFHSKSLISVAQLFIKFWVVVVYLNIVSKGGCLWENIHSLSKLLAENIIYLHKTGFQIFMAIIVLGKLTHDQGVSNMAGKNVLLLTWLKQRVSFFVSGS